MNVRLHKDQKVQIQDPNDVYKIMQQVLLRENKIRRDQEHFWILGMDNDNKVLFIELIGLGAVNRVNASPPTVFRMAIYKLAVKAILIHNHPSGNITPSESDLSLTDRMIKTGKLIEINVVDHLIISEDHYISLAQEGIMAKLHTSGNFEIVEKDQRKLEEWKIKMQREQAEHEKAIDIAKKMKDKGYDNETIQELTGLNKGDLNFLQ